MHREYHRWFARDLGRDMEMLTFGHAGRPYVVFPTSMGAFFEFEDRGMVDSLAPKLEDGTLQLFCVSTVDEESFYASMVPPRARVERYLRYERYLIGEVMPFIKQRTNSDTAGVTGCSFGAYHSFTMALRHPDVFTSCVCMGGAFDLMRVLKGWVDEAYLLSPPHFLPNLADEWFLERCRRNKWLLVTGERDICRADTEQASRLLNDKGIPNSLHVWGDGSEHDWPEWKRMVAAYLP